MNTAQQTYKYLDDLSRTRALTLRESIALQRAISHLDNIGVIDPRKWTPEDDAVMRNMHAKGHSFTEIGAALGRSKSACWCRFKRIKDGRAS